MLTILALAVCGTVVFEAANLPNVSFQKDIPNEGILMVDLVRIH
jgi:hypothetical protein